MTCTYSFSKMHSEKQGSLLKFIKWAMSGGRDLAQHTCRHQTGEAWWKDIIYRCRHAHTDKNSKKRKYTSNILRTRIFFKLMVHAPRQVPSTWRHAHGEFYQAVSFFYEKTERCFGMKITPIVIYHPTMAWYVFSVSIQTHQTMTCHLSPGQYSC